jgi:hypothetical protein
MGVQRRGESDRIEMADGSFLAGLDETRVA